MDKTRNNICESCAHIMQEKGESFESLEFDRFSLAYECKNINEYCEICGQLIINKNQEDQEKDLSLLESALSNKNLKVICFTAPSIRVSLGDEFGFSAGENVEGKMVSALKKLGFYAVFDMNTSADFTIIEEAKELEKRIKSGENLPMFTSCCPGWVNYCTKVCKEFIPNLSTCKSPQQMFGSLLNTYYAERLGVKSTDLFIVSIVPCLAKKLEHKQEGINSSVGLDVDVAITTREIAKLIKKNNLKLKNLRDEKFDDFFGCASGAGAIFGNTGGVMEAVLRSFGDSITQKEQKMLEYEMVRGIDSIKRAEVKIGNKVLKLAVVMGLKNVNVILNELRQDPKKYDFVEVMACEGGCIGGAGQPPVGTCVLDNLLEERAKGLYALEKNKEHRKAHKNPAVLKVYNDFLGEVGGEKAKKLLHRTY
ncbi:MAG: iron hydrogenase small subunit [Clostridia bacterium]|nr:iron hydrogenase small subunit [Clostridia bacterium]